MKEFRKQFGAHLRHLRVSKHLSQDQFYAICGVTKSYLSLIESGKARITIDTIKTISDGLGVRASELFDFELSNNSIKDLKERLIKTISSLDDTITPEELYKALLSDLFNK